MPRFLECATHVSLDFAPAASYEGVSDASIECTEVLTVPLPFAVRKSRKLDFIETSHHARLQSMRREGAILTRPAEYFIRCTTNTGEIFAHPVIWPDAL
jgi:hypothetical protein